MKLNPYLLAASIVAAFTTAIHVFVGGVTISTPLLASTLATVPKLTLYAVWHMVSFTLAFSTIAFFIGSFQRYANVSLYMGIFVSVLWIFFGIVFLVVAATQSESGLWLKLGQWILLIPTGVLGLYGSKKVLQATTPSRA